MQALKPKPIRHRAHRAGGYITAAEGARIAAVTPYILRRFAEAGEIGTHQVGARLLYRRADCERLAAKLE